jgi:cobaltochelatase CobT
MSNEQISSSVVRGFTGQAGWRFHGASLLQDGRAFAAFAPHLRQDGEGKATDNLPRGIVDGFALRACYSDAALHACLAPHDPLEQLLFEWFEQFRCEALARVTWPGLCANVNARFERWSIVALGRGLLDTEYGLLLFAVGQMVRSRVLGHPMLEDLQDRIEGTRMALVPRIGAQLYVIAKSVAHQQTYAEHALVIAKKVREMLEQAATQDPRKDSTKMLRELLALGLLVEIPGESKGLPNALAADRREQNLVGVQASYRAYTTAFDRELKLSSLVRLAQLQEYRAKLDLEITALAINRSRLERRLRALFSQPEASQWVGGNEEGVIDGRRLARIATNAMDRAVFLDLEPSNTSSATVCFLLDCSGSMRESMPRLLAYLDSILRALEAVGVSTQVLGFTTLSWNGGRAGRAWAAQGKPNNPGRLNEVCHLVIKDVDTSYRRARLALAGLLKPDLFREGIDGEALAWACQRVSRQSERTKCVVMVSDGSPMDRATALANDETYLDEHLQQVLHEQQYARQLCVGGIDVKAQPRAYFEHALQLPPEGETSGAVIDAIVSLLETMVRRGR